MPEDYSFPSGGGISRQIIKDFNSLKPGKKKLSSAEPVPEKVHITRLPLHIMKP
jgi:hypothetical protein